MPDVHITINKFTYMSRATAEWGKIMSITLKDIKESKEVKVLYENAQEQLDVLSFTEHSYRHAEIVSRVAGQILKEVGCSEREVELGLIAGYLHDIGNAVNRVDHPNCGALLAYNLLLRMGMDIEEAAQIMLAVGNHDENSGAAVSKISSALILADKSDVHRTRVRNYDFATFGIHDRVNYAVERSEVKIDKPRKTITLDLTIDTTICSMMEYFEIFLTRMMMNVRAATFFGYNFGLMVNDTKLL
jgi:metal-dependent HD superfamily phosphatase/phosphodiesterase